MSGIGRSHITAASLAIAAKASRASMSRFPSCAGALRWRADRRWRGTRSGHFDQCGSGMHGSGRSRSMHCDGRASEPASIRPRRSDDTCAPSRPLKTKSPATGGAPLERYRVGAAQRFLRGRPTRRFVLRGLMRAAVAVRERAVLRFAAICWPPSVCVAEATTERAYMICAKSQNRRIIISSAQCCRRAQIRPSSGGTHA